MFEDADEATLAAIKAWRDKPAKHQPAWPKQDELDAAVSYLRSLPPLIFAGEADFLMQQMGQAERGEAFVLMGGDCAESFADSGAQRIRMRIRTLLQMAVVLTYGASVPVVKIGRMAGQYAKPRSNDTETRGGVVLPAYRGDAVNGLDFTEQSRRHDPNRLMEVYNHSAATLNLIRAFVTGGFADLRAVQASRNAMSLAESGLGKGFRPVLEQLGDGQGVARVVHLDIGRDEERDVEIGARAARVRQSDDGELFTHFSLLGEGQAVVGPQR